LPRRLIGQQDRRLVDERSPDRRALLLAAGELVGQAVALAVNAHRVQHARDRAGDDLPVERAGHPQAVGQVLEDGLVADQPEVLEDHSAAAAQVRHLPARDGVAAVVGHLDDALGGLLLQVIILRTVDLPAPLSPSRKTISPASMRKLRSSIAQRRPGPGRSC